MLNRRRQKSVLLVVAGVALCVEVILLLALPSLLPIEFYEVDKHRSGPSMGKVLWMRTDNSLTKPKTRGQDSGAHSYSPFRWHIVRWRKALWDWLIPFAQAAQTTGIWSFEWLPIENAVKYQLEISVEKSFRKVIRRVNVTGTDASLVLPMRRVYFWRVAGIDQEGERGIYSEVQQVKTPRSILAKEKPQKKKPSLKSTARKGRGGKSARAWVIPSEVHQVKTPRSNLAEDKPQKKKPSLKSTARKGRGEKSAMAWVIPSWVRLGISGSYLTEKSQSGIDNYEVRRSGLPMNQIFVALHRQFLRSEWELSAWYQYLRFVSNNTGLTLGQRNLAEPVYGARLLLKGAMRYQRIPLTFGIFAERRIESQRVISEQLNLVGVTLGGIVLGASWSQLVGRDFYWHNDLLIEGSPIGKVTGVAFVWRSRFGWWKTRPLVPEFQLLVRPSLFRIGSQDETLTGLSVTFSVVLGGLFDGPAVWSRPGRFPLNRRPGSATERSVQEPSKTGNEK